MTTLKKNWALDLLNHLNVDLKIIGLPVQQGPLIALGNHISYLDIPILIAAMPTVSFLAKNEVKYWPVIGSAAVKMDTIFVKRGSSNSRKKSKEQISETLRNKNSVIAGFPSGTTTLDELKPWRLGLFEIAAKNNIAIQPFRIYYEPLREVAYIDEDHFLKHLYQLVKLKQIKATIEFHPPALVKDTVTCSQHWQKWTQGNG